MGRRGVLAALVVAAVLAGCGGDDEPDGAATTSTAHVSSVTESPYLRRVGRLSQPLLVPLGDGALVYGGAELAASPDRDEASVEPVAQGVVVRPGGLAVPVPAIPTEDPLYALRGVATERAVFVSGLTCATGHEADDTGASGCEPGEQVVARLDLEGLRWSILAGPGDLPDSYGDVGGADVAASGPFVAVTVTTPDGEASTWLSEQADPTWREVDDPPGALCGVGGGIVALDVEGGRPVVSPLDDASGTWGPAESPPSPAGTVARGFCTPGGVGAVDDAGVVHRWAPGRDWLSVEVPGGGVPEAAGPAAVDLVAPGSRVRVDLGTGEAEELPHGAPVGGRTVAVGPDALLVVDRQAVAELVEL